MRTHGALPGLVGTLLILIGGCGGGGSVSTGLPRDKALNTLTAEDMKTACKNTLSTQLVSDDAIRGSCIVSLSREGMAACTSGLDACIATTKMYTMTSTDPAQCDSATNTDTTHFASCAATVGEFEDCLSEKYDTATTTYKDLSCEHPTPPASNTASTEKCDKLKAKCPGIFEDDTRPA